MTCYPRIPVAIADSIDQLIGGTPLIRLNSISKPQDEIHVYGKLESLNPGCSVKDRTALRLIELAEASHQLGPGSTIVESSSGNLGHALAMLCAARKYHFICVIDPKAPRLTTALIKALGGQIELVATPDETGTFQKNRIARAKSIAESTPNCINLDQYNNPAAIDAHFRTTGPEIYRQLDGQVDVLIASASTGSHLSGTAKYLKSVKPGVVVVGVEPEGSVVFGGQYKPHLQNGAGLSFRPGNLLDAHIDRTVKVPDANAFVTCREIARQEGLLLGGSSGAVVHTAKEFVKHVSSPCNVVVILPDSGLKYVDTIYDDDWLRTNGIYV